MSKVFLTSARVALCQMKVTPDKLINLNHVETIIASALNNSPNQVDILVLPEIWNSPYATASFPIFAEPIPPIGSKSSTIISEISPSSSKLSNLAQQHKCWIIGGSIPEYEDSYTDSSLSGLSNRKIYNTCVVFDSEGTIVGKHRKMHLFDIDIPGKMTFKESDTLTGGDSITVVESPWGYIGIGICYDIRFPELAMLMRERGCKLLVYPGAFNLVTGPAHWELLLRSRAVDNQLYTIGCAPARNDTAAYVAYGYSTVVSPWGVVLAQAAEGEEVIYADLDFTKADEMRANIPTTVQKRGDVYRLEDITASKL